MYIIIILFLYGSGNWKRVTGRKVNFDLQNSPLRVKTKSSIGSKDDMRIFFFDADSAKAGGFKLRLETKPKYRLEYCQSKDVTINLPASLTDAEETIWKITLTSAPGVILHGNDEEIFNIQLSDTICKNTNWRRYWSRVPKKIDFTSNFKNNDFYFHPTGNLNSNN